MWVISVYDAKTDVVFALDRTKTPDVHAVFLLTLKFCSRVKCAPTEPFTNGIFSFLFVRAGKNVGSLKTQISQKKANTQISQKIPAQDLISLQRRGHLILKQLGVLCLNQPVREIDVRDRSYFT